MVKINNIVDYAAHTTALDRKLREYAINARGRERVKPSLFEDIVDRGGGRLMCANAAARIAFACEAESYLRETLNPSRSRQAFLMTLCPSFGIQRTRDLGRPSYTTASGEWTEPSHTFEGLWRKLISWTKHQLVGFSYLGAVDIAFYRTHHRSMTMGPVVCFHTHVLVWGRPKAEIEAVRDSINASDQSFVPDRTVAHIRVHNGLAGAVGGLLYAVKPPLSNYNIVPIKDEVTGIRRWKSQKAELRPGDAAFTASLLAGVEIDQISFAGGTAGSSVQRIAAASRQRLASGEEEFVSEMERRRQTGGR